MGMETGIGWQEKQLILWVGKSFKFTLKLEECLCSRKLGDYLGGVSKNNDSERDHLSPLPQNLMPDVGR
jgi:hypothetical protein